MGPLVPPSALRRNPYGSDVAAAEVCDDDQDEDEEMLDEFADVCEDEDLEDNSVERGLAPDPDLAATAKQKVRSTMPTWLASEYQNLRERLFHEIRSNSSHLPTCYDHRTFFDGIDNAFLVARSTFQLTPGLFHQPRFFVWLPHLLFDRIPCPSCLKAGRQVTRGSRVYLQKHGFANQPRRVVDIDHNIFIVGYRYVCGHKDSRKNFQSWSPSIIRLLPAPIADQFELRLTHRSGLSNRLAMLLRESFRSGVGPDQFTTMIESFHYRHFDHLHCQFLEMVSERSSRGSLSSCWTATSPFGEFGARDGYAGYVPRAPYFARFYDMLVEESAPAARQHHCLQILLSRTIASR
jgi:hypothetical protein